MARPTIAMPAPPRRRKPPTSAPEGVLLVLAEMAGDLTLDEWRDVFDAVGVQVTRAEIRSAAVALRVWFADDYVRDEVGHAAK